MEHANSRFRDTLALSFASLFPLVMAYLYFVVIDDPNGTANQIAYSGGKVVQFLFPLAFVWYFERGEIRWTPPSRRGIPLAVGFGLVVGIAMFVLYFTWIGNIPAVRDETPAKIWAKVRQAGITDAPRFLLMAFFLSGLHSLAEEYYWRWFVFGWMRRHMPLGPAVVLSSLGFMLHHVVILGVYFPNNFWMLALPFSLGVAIGGGVWAWIYDRSGSLYAPWLSHALVDAAIMGLGYVMLNEYW